MLLTTKHNLTMVETTGLVSSCHYNPRYAFYQTLQCMHFSASSVDLQLRVVALVVYHMKAILMHEQASSVCNKMLTKIKIWIKLAL